MYVHKELEFWDNLKVKKYLNILYKLRLSILQTAVFSSFPIYYIH